MRGSGGRWALRLADLLDGVAFLDRLGAADVDVRGVSYDSRTLQPGQIFVACRGSRADGHAHLGAAFAAGAVAAVVERPEALPQPLPPGHAAVVVPDSRRALAELSAALNGHPTARLRLVGITGTNGKTTTAFLTRAILQTLGPVGLVGTVAAVVGGRQFRPRLTTPEAPDLQSLFAGMVEAGDRYCVMEVSSQALARQRVRGCAFDIGVFTNLTPDHLGPGEHPNFVHYRESKRHLFEMVGQTPVGAAPKPGPYGAVINGDDPAGTLMAAALAPGIALLHFGLEHGRDVRAEDISLDASGAAFTIRHPEGRSACRIALPGRFNVANALAAFCVGLLQGVSPDAAADALGRVPGVPGRLEPVGGTQPFAVLVDYAHTPDGLENVLRAAREITSGRVIAVFGCGGDRDRGKRPLMGEIGARLADLSWLTSDNPRTESPDAILEDVEAGAAQVPGAAYHRVVDRRQAIGEALAAAGPGDVVVIAGKGHEDYQIFAHGTIHFDDREEAAAALARLGYR